MNVKSFSFAVLGGAIGCLIILFILFLFNPILFNPSAVRAASQPLPSGNLNDAAKLNNELGDIDIISSAAEKIMPSVVYIDTRTFMEVDQPVISIFGIPGYRSQIVPKEGRGSGVVWDKNGIILTNEHVIHGANEIMVTFQNEQTYPAVVKGVDPISDLAVLQVKAENLTPAVLGDSELLKIGQPVIAVGSPYHFQQTVTYGVISGRGRNLSDQSKDFQDLLQTDAAINPGNSGGPLVNLKGEVIGINTAIIPYAQGIGFAIPINTVKNVANQLIEKGKVLRSYIGITMMDLNPQLAAYIGCRENGGVAIIGVERNSPGDQAGLQPKDVILKVGGKKITSGDELRNIIRKSAPGEQISLEIWRHSQIMEVSVKMAGR